MGAPTPSITTARDLQIHMEDYSKMNPKTKHKTFWPRTLIKWEKMILTMTLTKVK